MVLDQLKFLTTIQVENRIPRRLIPKIRAALKFFPAKRHKIFVKFGRLHIPELLDGWFKTTEWIVEHYYIIEDKPNTSLGDFMKTALHMTRRTSKYWVFVKGYDCDGFRISPFQDGITMDHAIVFIDGIIALKVETHNGKYFIADYFFASMDPRTSNEIAYLWYDYEKEHFE